jgi:hypothetical protein
MFSLPIGQGIANGVTDVNPQTPVAEVEAGGWWESTNAGLSSALDLWGKVETIKGAKSATGQDQLQAMHQPELANGATIQVDKSLETPTSKTGFTIEKPVLYASLGLLGLAFIMRMKGFR